jgi:putative tricarboxylic transport membrane protein
LNRSRIQGSDIKGRAVRSPDAWLGAGLLLLAIGVAIEGANVTSVFGYDTVGPRAFPYLIAAGLFMSGASILVAAWRHDAPFQTGERHGWIAVVAISVTLLMEMLLIKPLGWIPVSTAAFAIVASIFGSRQVLRNIVFGAVLAGATFVLFNFGLGFRLPVGGLVEALL